MALEEPAKRKLRPVVMQQVIMKRRLTHDLSLKLRVTARFFCKSFNSSAVLGLSPPSPYWLPQNLVLPSPISSTTISVSSVST